MSGPIPNTEMQPPRPRPSRRVRPKSLLTRPLGLEGWVHLEAPLLAALVTEAPLLLVGKHGTAKSFLLERLAQAMKLEYRFYNASLLNYDDLVGIPVPTSDQTALRYISTPTAVWEAEVVFLDEINRTRPDLQNKLFPLIHERRVQGVDLTRLRYRWAAMNPPALDADSESSENYVGAEPLDPALADRFAFILEVPDWDSLTGSEQRSILLDQFKGRHEFPVSIDALLSSARTELERLQADPPSVMTEYLIAFASQRGETGHRLSPRRLSTLMRNILAVHASRIALQQAAQPRNAKEPVEVDTETSVWTAVQHSQPSIAQTGRLDRHGLRAAHRHAWQLVGLDENDPWKSLLTIKDPVKRFIKAVETPGTLSDDALGQLALDAVAGLPDKAKRTAFALAAYLRLSEHHTPQAMVIETLATLVRPVLQPGNRTIATQTAALQPAPGMPVLTTREQLEYRNAVAAMTSGLATQDAASDPRRSNFRINLLEALLPDGYVITSPKTTVEYFDHLWDALSLDATHSDVERR